MGAPNTERGRAQVVAVVVVAVVTVRAVAAAVVVMAAKRLADEVGGCDRQRLGAPDLVNYFTLTQVDVLYVIL